MNPSGTAFSRARKCLPARFQEQASARHKQLMPSDSTLTARLQKLGPITGRESIQRTIRLAGAKAYDMHMLGKAVSQCLAILGEEDHDGDPRASKLRKAAQRAWAQAMRTSQELTEFILRSQRKLDEGAYESRRAGPSGRGDAAPSWLGLSQQVRPLTDPAQIRIGPKCGVSVRSKTGKWAPLPSSRLYRLQGAARQKLNRCLTAQGLPTLFETSEVQALIRAQQADAPEASSTEAMSAETPSVDALAHQADWRQQQLASLMHT